MGKTIDVATAEAGFRRLPGDLAAAKATPQRNAAEIERQRLPDEAPGRKEDVANRRFIQRLLPPDLPTGVPIGSR